MPRQGPRNPNLGDASDQVLCLGRAASGGYRDRQICEAGHAIRQEACGLLLRRARQRNLASVVPRDPSTPWHQGLNMSGSGIGPEPDPRLIRDPTRHARLA